MSTDHSTQEQVRVGILGVGLMGSAMAGRLVDQDIAVSAWDRDRARAHALRDRGTIAADEPGDRDLRRQREASREVEQRDPHGGAIWIGATSIRRS